MKKLVILIVVCILMSLISCVSSAEGQNNDDPQWMIAGNLAEYPENRWGQVWPQDAFLLKPAPNGSVTGYYGLQTILNLRAGDEFKLAVIDANGTWIYSLGANFLLSSDYATEGTDYSLDDPNIMITKDGQYKITLISEIANPVNCLIIIFYVGPLSASTSTDQGGYQSNVAENEPQGLEGRWKLKSIDNRMHWVIDGVNLLNADMIYEFRFNVMMVYAEGFGNTVSAGRMGIGYSLEGNKLMFGSINMGTYEISGNTLTFLDPSGAKLTFERLPEKTVETTPIDGDWELVDIYSTEVGWIFESEYGSLVSSYIDSKFVFYDHVLYRITSLAGYSLAALSTYLVDEETHNIYYKDIDESRQIFYAWGYEYIGDQLTLTSSDGTIILLRRK